MSSPRGVRLWTGGVGGHVAEVVYDLDDLRVVVDFGDSGRATFVFHWPVGFRVLDEGDLLEFWAQGSVFVGGTLFQVESGGWLEQEQLRPTFLSGNGRGTLLEFLVTGQNDCVSVLTDEPPRIDVEPGPSS